MVTKKATIVYIYLYLSMISRNRMESKQTGVLAEKAESKQRKKAIFAFRPLRQCPFGPFYQAPMTQYSKDISQI